MLLLDTDRRPSRWRGKGGEAKAAKLSYEQGLKRQGEEQQQKMSKRLQELERETAAERGALWRLTVE